MWPARYSVERSPAGADCGPGGNEARRISSPGVKGWAQSVRRLKNEDVANVILFAVSPPGQVCINEILMRPTDQER